MSSQHNETRGGQAEDGVVLTPEQARSRRARNIAIGVAVALLAILFYAITVVRLGGAVASRAI
ncbi:hypothetical protein [Methylocystis echinoides]|uniref:hypothetical protein n=1 Tax=Methylocystis echinoides TaxID=29468 RepID=UPI00342CDAF7